MILELDENFRVLSDEYSSPKRLNATRIPRLREFRSGILPASADSQRVTAHRRSNPGPVHVGNNSLIRSYTSVGSHCSVGYGVELKNCIVLDNSKIGRLSFIGDSVLGENVDFGAGSMTVNRTVDWKPIVIKTGGKKLRTGMVKVGAFIGKLMQIILTV